MMISVLELVKFCEKIGRNMEDVWIDSGGIVWVKNPDWDGWHDLMPTPYSYESIKRVLESE